MWNNNECLLRIKAKGENQYYSRKDIYPNNIYNVLIRLDLSKIEMNKSAEIFFYCDSNHIDSCTAQIIIEIDADEKCLSFTDVIHLDLSAQTVIEIVKGTTEIIGLKNCVSLTKTFEEQSSLLVFKEQLDGSGMIELRFCMRSIPLLINMDIDSAGKEKINDDLYLKELRENGVNFHVEVVNAGDQIEQGLFVYCIPPVGQQYITGSTEIGTEDCDSYIRDDTDSICKEGLMIGDISPGETTNLFFDLKMSNRTFFGERKNLFQNSIYMRRGTAKFWQCHTGALDLFESEKFDIIKEETSQLPSFTQERVCEYEGLVEGTDFGPERKTFCDGEEPDIRSFNAITDHPVFGDERQFILIRPVNSSEKFTVNTEVVPGEIYEIMIFYHIINPSGMIWGSSVYIKVPDMIPAGQTVDLKAELSGEQAVPKTVWSKIRLSSKEDVKIEVVNNVAVHYGRIQNDGMYIDLSELGDMPAYRWFIDDGSPLGICGNLTSNNPGYYLFRIRVVSMAEGGNNMD